MGMFRNWKVRRLRKRIINDPRLSEWEKDEAIRKLDEKEQSLVRVEPVYPEKIAEHCRDVSHKVPSKFIGEIQVGRLKARNEMLDEMGKTIDKTVTIKKSWERLKNIEEEIAEDKKHHEEKQTEREITHIKTMKQLALDQDKIDNETKAEKIRALHEREALREKRDEFKKGLDKSKEAQLKELEEEEELNQKKFEIEKKRAEHRATLDNIEWESGQKHKEVEPTKVGDTDAFNAAWDAVEAADLPEDVRRKTLQSLNKEYGFKRDVEEG